MKAAAMIPVSCCHGGPKFAFDVEVEGRVARVVVSVSDG